MTAPTDVGTGPVEPGPGQTLDLPVRTADGRKRTSNEQAERSIVSTADWHRPTVRWGLTGTQWLLLLLLLIIGLGPILWLAKASITSTQDTLRYPLQLFPNGVKWSNITAAWTRIHIGLYLKNTVILAAGSWAAQLFVATTAGYALSVLRPRYAAFLTGLVVSTLLVPAVVLLVPLYLTIVKPPLLGHSLINSYWAVWLPAAANAFNVILVKRFFDSLPREIFEAAKVDGAGPFRLFWSIVLPMSRPILGVVSVFAVITAWKDFLWPLLVLPDPNKQPVSVRLPNIALVTDLGTLLAAMFISTIVPLLLFLAFQRFFLRGAGLGGALKG